MLVDAGSRSEVEHSIVIDSGSGIHITPIRSFVDNLRPLSRHIPLKGVFGAPVYATHYGEGAVAIGGYTLHVGSIVYMPGIKDTLLSYVRLERDGHRIAIDGEKGTYSFVDKKGVLELPLSGRHNILTFDRGKAPIIRHVRQLIDRGGAHQPTSHTRVNALTRSTTREENTLSGNQHTQHTPNTRRTETTPHQPDANTTMTDVEPVETPPFTLVDLAHARFGHLGARKLKQLAEIGGTKIDLSSISRLTKGNKSKLNLCEQSCDACVLGKMHRPKFSDEYDHEVEKPNDKVVADVCGPIWTRDNKDGTHTKFSMSTITDVYSRHLEVKIIQAKSEASDHCISYLHASEIHTGNRLKHFHADGGTEYNSFETVAKRHGTKVTRTPPDTPQRNGIAERKNRTILEMARSLLFHAKLNAASFWQFAIETAVIVHNRCTVVTTHGKTQHELYTGHQPDLSWLRVFGCDAFVLTVHPGSKLAPRSQKGIFLGYDLRREHCYRVKVGGQLFISRDVEFNETSFTVDRNVIPPPAGAAVQPGESVSPPTVSSEGGDRARAELRKNGGVTAGASATVADLGGEVMNHTTPDHADDNTDNTSSTPPTSSSSTTSRNDRSRREPASAGNSSVEDSVGSHVDARTKRKLEAARAREETKNKGKRHTSSDQLESNRRSTRNRVAAKQTGMNLDDFGHVMFRVTDSPVSKFVPVNVSSLEGTSTATKSTAEHSPDTIPKENTIRASYVQIPLTRKQAMNSPYWQYWRAAEVSEYESLAEHGTYVLVPCPSPLPNLVSCKWVYDVKVKDGFVVRFKARLVARGFSQQAGIDYEETYSPVLKYKALRLILAIVAEFGLQLELMDVQTAYLHATLKEQVYMQQPEGFEQVDTQANHGRKVTRPLVCLLLKALYGLKQAGREWNLHLDSFVCSLGFRRCLSDSCVYVRSSRSGRPLLLSVYVDDIPSAYHPLDALEWGEVKAAFFDRFKISFQPEADWLLNMRITRDPNTRHRLLLDQQSYIEQILEERNMDECKSVDHPGAQEPLSKAGEPANDKEREEMKSIPYRQVLGALSYLSNTTRPDITHAVSQCARYAENPGPSHWQAMNRILRYLSGTREYGLLFERKHDTNESRPSSRPHEHNTQTDHATSTTNDHNTNRTSCTIDNTGDNTPSFPLVGYADADWAGCLDTRRSTTGAILTFCGSVIDWSSKRQSTAALSSCEAEYMAIAATLQSVMWVKNMLGELGFHLHGPAAGEHTNQSSQHPTHARFTAGILTTAPVELFNDNKSAIAMANNDCHHSRSKHIDLRYHFVREAVAEGSIALKWCSTHEQIADILTKALPSITFRRIRDFIVFPRSVVLPVKKN